MPLWRYPPRCRPKYRRPRRATSRIVDAIAEEADGVSVFCSVFRDPRLLQRRQFGEHRARFRFALQFVIRHRLNRGPVRIPWASIPLPGKSAP